jgi:hypothetical protein
MGNILDPRCVVCADPYMVHKPSDNLKASSDSTQNTTSASYTKIKEITVADYAPKINDKDIGKLRVKFDLATNNASVAAYGRIYKNGVALGTERSTTGTSYTTYSEDLEFKAGDKIQLYAHSDGTNTASVKNFRIYADGICLSCGYNDSMRTKHSW